MPAPAERGPHRCRNVQRRAAQRREPPDLVAVTIGHRAQLGLGERVALGMDAGPDGTNESRGPQHPHGARRGLDDTGGQPPPSGVDRCVHTLRAPQGDRSTVGSEDGHTGRRLGAHERVPRLPCSGPLAPDHLDDRSVLLPEPVPGPLARGPNGDHRGTPVDRAGSRSPWDRSVQRARTPPTRVTGVACEVSARRRGRRTRRPPGRGPLPPGWRRYPHGPPRARGPGCDPPRPPGWCRRG